jgi:hypothetical protein
MGPPKKLSAVVQAVGCLYSATNFAANAGWGFFAASGTQLIDT